MNYSSALALSLILPLDTNYVLAECRHFKLDKRPEPTHTSTRSTAAGERWHWAKDSKILQWVLCEWWIVMPLCLILTKDILREGRRRTNIVLWRILWKCPVKTFSHFTLRGLFVVVFGQWDWIFFRFSNDSGKAITCVVWCKMSQRPGLNLLNTRDSGCNTIHIFTAVTTTDMLTRAIWAAGFNTNANTEHYSVQWHICNALK